MTPERLEEIREILSKATPGPWGPYTANIPFYAIVKKPAPSLSKHDSDRPEYWRVEDATFVALAREAMPELVDEVLRLRESFFAGLNYAQSISEIALDKTLDHDASKDLDAVMQRIALGGYDARDAYAMVQTLKDIQVENAELRNLAERAVVAGERLAASNARLREALESLANEADGFLQCADAMQHGVTNMQILSMRINEARAALSEGK